MSDSPDMSLELQHSLFAKAATLVIWKRGIRGDYDRYLKPRINALLEPFFQGRRARGSKRPLRGSSWIRKAWLAVRGQRNNFWHPQRRGGRRYKFSRQQLVLPMMIALRVVYALILARLAEMHVLREKSKLRLDIPAVAQWIGSLGPDLENGLVVPEYPADPNDDLARSRYVEVQMAWNAAARSANNWGRFRSEERMQAGITEAVRRIKRSHMSAAQPTRRRSPRAPRAKQCAERL